MLTSEEMIKIMVDVDLGRESGDLSEEANQFRIDVAKEIKEIKDSGKAVEIPVEWGISE